MYFCVFTTYVAGRLQAPPNVAKGHMAARVFGGILLSRTVSAVVIPNVPYEPTNRRVRS